MEGKKGGCGSGGLAVVHLTEGRWVNPWPLQSKCRSILEQNTEPQIAPSNVCMWMVSAHNEQVSPGHQCTNGCVNG